MTEPISLNAVRISMSPSMLASVVVFVVEAGFLVVLSRKKASKKEASFPVGQAKEARV